MDGSQCGACVYTYKFCDGLAKKKTTTAYISFHHIYILTFLKLLIMVYPKSLSINFEYIFFLWEIDCSLSTQEPKTRQQKQQVKTKTKEKIYSI
jgi:hypothetical protein